MKLLLWNNGRGWDSQYSIYSSARGSISSQGGRTTDALRLDVVMPVDSCVGLAAGGFPLDPTLVEVSDPYTILYR